MHDQSTALPQGQSQGRAAEVGAQFVERILRDRLRQDEVPLLDRNGTGPGYVQTQLLGSKAVADCAVGP